MSDEHETDTKHQHTYTLNVSIKGISYAAVIGVLGVLGFGGDDLSANGEKIHRFTEQSYMSIKADIVSLKAELDKLSAMFTAFKDEADD